MKATPELPVAAASAPRVIFVNRFFHPDISATSQMLTDLASRLARRGVDVHVICSRRRYEGTGPALARRERVLDVEVHRVWSTGGSRSSIARRLLGYLSFYLSAIVAMFRLARPGDVLIVKTDPPMLSVFGALVADLRAARLVNWLQDIYPEVAMLVGRRPLPRWLVDSVSRLRDWSLNGARMNVVLGERMAHYLRERGVPETRIRVIENWADGDLIVPMSPDSSSLRARLRLHQRFVVSYSGNLGRAHDHETILAAAEELAPDPGVVFLMIGGGAKMSLLRKTVLQRGLGNFVFLPYQSRSDLSDSLGAANVHLVSLLPGLEEYMVPSKFYGILAAERPVVFIGDKDGDVPRVIRETGCGIVVRPGDGAGLVRELTRLRANPEVMHEAAERGRKVLVERYAADRQTGSWFDALREVCPGLVASREVGTWGTGNS